MRQRIVNDIRVIVRPPTNYGQLRYRRDPQIEAHILYVRSLDTSPRKYLISINGGEANLGIGGDHTLQTIEFCYPRRAWNITPFLGIPSPLQIADLLIPDVIERFEVIEWPRGSVVFSTNETQSFVQILFGEEPPDAQWVAMSEQCLALIAQDRLKGFFIKLK